MIDVQFLSGSASPDTGGIWCYRILDTVIRSNRELGLLRTFAVAEQEPGEFNPPATPRTLGQLDHHSDIASSSIVVHDHSIQLDCRTAQGGLLLQLDDHTRIQVSPSLCTLWLEQQAPIPVSLLEQLVLGPGLVFLLTCKQIHFLHGSAIATPAGIVLFVGTSGSGKSTLARELTRIGNDWTLVADDIVAVHTGASDANCLPLLPQPKLPDDQQPTSFAESIPLLGIFTLNPCPGHERAAVAEGLSPASSAVALINHVMGSGTGVPTLERNILHAASNLVEKVGIQQLNYPHGPTGPLQVHALLSDHIQRLIV